MSIIFICLAAFLTWFCSRTRNMLVALAASITWIGLAMWIFFAPLPVIPLGDLYTKFLVWVLIMMTFVPLTLQMNYEVKHEGKHGSWTEVGEKPQEDYPDTIEAYKKTLHKRWGRR